MRLGRGSQQSRLTACCRILQLGTGRRPSMVNRLTRLTTLTRQVPFNPGQAPRTIFTSSKKPDGKNPLPIVPVVFAVGGLLIFSVYSGEEVRQVRAARKEANDRAHTARQNAQSAKTQTPGPDTAWGSFTNRFEAFSDVADIEWSALSDRLVDLILPDWSRNVPSQIRKLQRELSTEPGSLAGEIWNEAHDPFINPEIRYSAKVRVSDQLCNEEKEFLSRRKRIATAALANYLGIKEKDIHPDDVPTIAMCGSGGGLRALVAGTGSMLATQEDGLFDCVTYTSGVSGSCWLQSILNSSLTHGRLDRIIAHLKDRLGTHIAYPPVAFGSVTSAPTNKLLLSSLVEKLKGDENAEIGLVDIYGILLAARLLVPKGELGVNDRDFKLSNQRDYVKYGQSPMPIYTAVRHEIPELDEGAPASEQAKDMAKKEAWFQWYEMTPYEFFCEEFNAGIPTWAMGRNFDKGEDVAPESGFHLPELRMPLLMGIFGSAFCATLSHYYREVRPLVRNLTGFSALDEMIHTRNEDLEKVHPFDPARIPNFAYNMEGMLRFTTPTNIHKNPYIQLMDAGMSNNLPIYPLLRPGRDVDIIVAFDASADVKTDNWLAVADGYARQRGIKGWPVGVGWPKSTDSPAKVEQQLEDAQAATTSEAESKIEQAQHDQATRRASTGDQDHTAKHDIEHPESSDLGYCTIWAGTTEERSSEPPPPRTAITENNSWQLLEPNAGIAVVYLPFLSNPKVKGVDPAASDFLSTWNFVYTPEQVEQVVSLARANYDEGKEQIRRCVRAVYERKKKQREQREDEAGRETLRKDMRRGVAGSLGEGDHFS